MTRRGSLHDAQPRYSLMGGLPAVFHTDGFLSGLVDGFDRVLAPVHATLDDLDAYLDPATCPPDFLDWLGSWLGVEVSERWPIHRRRELLARAVEVYRWRGTTKGIQDAIELYTGIVPVVTDSGAVSASAEPLGAMPGSNDRRVTITMEGRSDISLEVVEAIVAATIPVHCASSIAITRSAGS